jgi:hypothetical protein
MEVVMACARAFVVGLVLIVLTPGVALADGFVTPFFGINFGGDSDTDFQDAADADRYDWGVSLGWMGGGIIGVEGDFGYSSDFFGKTDFGGSSLWTLMGNVLVGVPIGGQVGFGFRPYGLAGLGMMRPEGDAFPAAEVFGENKVAWNFGGGFMMFFADHVGFRADIRYFRTFEAVDFLDLDIADETGDLDFTRGSLGLTLRF